MSVLFTLALVLQLPPTLAAQQTPANTALIVGRVLDQTDQRPISGAAVTLVRHGEFEAFSETPRRQITDALGRFVFRELPAGRYSLRSEYGGTGFSPNGFIQSGLGFRIGAYIDGGYGQRRPGGPLQPLIVAQGQTLPDLVIQMWKGAAISGTVTDDSGEPVVDTVIGAAQLSGDGRLINGPTVRTDDRGIYRLSALTPGRYIVFVPQRSTAMSAESADELMRRVVELKTAQDPAAPVAPVPDLTGVRVGSSIVKSAAAGFIDGSLMPRRDGDATFVFQTTFYPAAQTLSSAAPVEVASGDDRTGIDVLLQPLRAASLSGTLFAGGQPAGGARLRLVPADATPDGFLFETATARADGLGRFTFPLVPVGNYRVIASNDPAPDRPVPVPVPVGGPGAWVDQPVSVSPDGVKGLALTMRPGFSVRGQIEFSGTSPAPSEADLAKLTMSVRPESPRIRGDQSVLARSPVAANGTFAAIGTPPGRYFVRMAGLPTNSPWRIQSVAIGGLDVNDLAFDLSEDINNVRVVFTDRPASVSGRVTSAEPGDGAAVVLLFPADRSLWPGARAMTRRARMARTEPAGEFNFTDVPPGDYAVIAVLDAASVDWPDAAFLAKAFSAASQLRINAGDRPTLPLTVKKLQ